MKVAEALLYLRKKLSLIESEEEARSEALQILAHLLDTSPLNVTLHLEKEVPEELLNRIVEERLRYKPLPYILGKVYFFKSAFYVEEGVFIPRGDTELLVEVFLNLPIREGFFLELGCGTGAISISILLERPLLKAVAVDISLRAIEIARKNAQLHGVEERLFLLRGDWYTPLSEKRLYQVIISNPPYISYKESLILPRDVLEYEPSEALFAGPKGTEFHERILAEAEKYLAPGGFIIFELGYNQAQAIKELASNWKIKFFRDLQNYERVSLLWKEEDT